MKKILVMLLALTIVFALASCGGKDPCESCVDEDKNGVCDVCGEKVETPDPDPDPDPDPEPDPAPEAMTHAEYVAAEDGANVTIEAFVQAKQGWWENKAVIYLQDENGGYFVYNLPITEDEYNKLVDGQKIRVSGKKTIYRGQHEIYDDEATYEILDGNWKATATDVTALLGTEELINHQNKFVSFKGLTVVASEDAEGNEHAWMYGWNGAGDEGGDLYFTVSDGKNTYSFTIESYLTGADSDVYKAVKELKIGDVIDCEGFLYWYDGVNPHITSVTVVTPDAE